MSEHNELQRVRLAFHTYYQDNSSDSRPSVDEFIRALDRGLFQHSPEVLGSEPDLLVREAAALQSIQIGQG